MQASIGKQIICENQNYPVHYKIWDALEVASRAREKTEAGKSAAVHA
jgi:hypothetical protein